ncbi:MAG: glycosyl hydrolase [Verrucomicrobiae bacterium]|nr:glycosyl hydrolase [Verrucomicrobiae bacterium]MDW8309954.1 glycosyl hydrolase [Verrucomicrobiales bacterium]
MNVSPSNAALRIEPLWNAPAKPFAHTWAGMINVDQFRWFVRADMQEQLARAVVELGARHVRAVGMFDDEMRFYTVDPATWQQPREQRPPELNFQVIDYVMDALLERGLRPVFTTTFMPGALAATEATVFETGSRVSLPRDWALWEKLVTEAVRHAVARYGLAEVRQWYFEVWNEPNLRVFFDGEQKDFWQLWERTRAAIKSVDAALRVGGPSTARGEWLPEFLAHTAAAGCPPDFLITHVYNNDGLFGALSPFDGPQEERASHSPHFAARVIRGVRKLLGELGYRGEVHWNEWGRTWHPTDPLRETPVEAAWCVKTMAEVADQADCFAWWCLSDIYNQVGYQRSEFAAHYGMLSLHGLRKPVYVAHQMLNRLGNERVPVVGDGGEPLAHAIVTRRGAAWQALVYAFAETTEARATTVELILPNQPERPPRLTRLGARENNILAAWRAMGAPPYPSREQLKELRAVNTFAPAPADALRIESRSGRWVAVLEMETPGLALVET